MYLSRLPRRGLRANPPETEDQHGPDSDPFHIDLDHSRLNCPLL
jgi:hypothetical protein